MKQTKRNRYQQEWSLKNYLKKHKIPGDPNEIINAFYESRGGNPSSTWNEIIQFCQDHFGLFCQFAQNKYKTNPIIVGEADHISPDRFSQIQERIKASSVDYNPGSTWNPLETNPDLKLIGVITRDRRVFNNFLRVDLNKKSTEGYIQIENIEQVSGRTFSKVYVIQDSYFSGRLEIIKALRYRGAEILYV